MPWEMFHKFSCFHSLAILSCGLLAQRCVVIASICLGLCLTKAIKARFTRELDNRWFLLGEAMKRTETPDQVGRVQAGDRPAGKVVSQNIQC